MNARLGFAAPLFALAVSLFAADSAVPLPAMTPPSPERERGFHFALPRGFQRNPRLSMTAVTEFTAYGRTLPAPAADHPIYYRLHLTPMQQRGALYAGLRAPPRERLTAVLEHSLRERGFLPADEHHPPSLALIVHWGAHSVMDLEMRGLFPQQASKHRSERLLLVGGHRYQDFVRRRHGSSENPFGHPHKYRWLLEQAMQDLYFVIISAYDHDALARNERRLAWRTHLTVDALGVPMTETLPALIVSGAPFLGREMTEPATIFRRLRRGVVEFGEARVLETDVPLDQPK